MDRSRPDGGAPPVIHAMTGVRALALVVVITYHFHEQTSALLPATASLGRWLQFALLALDVFFMLSGFVISYNFAERLAGGDRRERTGYLVARFARIYPVHLLTFLATAVLVGWFAARGTTFDTDRTYTVAGFVGNLFVLQSVPGIQAWNAPSWSVPVEVAAYVAFPVFAGLLVRLRSRTAAVLAVGMVFLLVVSIRGIVALPTFQPLLLLWVRLVCDFTIGCLLWAVWRRGFQPHWRWDLVAVAALGCVAVTIRLGGATVTSWFAVGFLAVFLFATSCATGVVGSSLASRPIEYLGRISYSVYLVHYPVRQLVKGFLPHELFAASTLPTRVGVVAIYFVGSLAIGALLYHLVEEPSRRWIRRSSAPWVASRPTGGGRDAEGSEAAVVHPRDPDLAGSRTSGR